MLTVRRFAARYSEFEAAGVEPVAVFHSPAIDLRSYAVGDHALPFPVLADPSKTVYAQYGAERHWTAVLHPVAAWRGMLAMFRGLFPKGEQARRDGMTGKPADFLIDAEGRIERCHYGKHFADALPVEEALRWITATR